MAIGVQAVGSAVQGQARLVVAHLRIEGLDLGAGDIGRIGDDQVVAAVGQPLRPAAAFESGAVGQAQGGGVLQGDFQSRLGDIYAQPMGARAFRQDGEQDGARAHPQVEDAEGPVFGEVGQDHIQDRLGVRPRRQDIGGDLEHDLPEAATAEDMADRLARLAAGEEGFEPLFLGVGEQAVGIGDDIGPGGVGRGFEQQARVDHRAVDGGGLKPSLCHAPGFDEAERHWIPGPWMRRRGMILLRAR